MALASTARVNEVANELALEFPHLTVKPDLEKRQVVATVYTYSFDWQQLCVLGRIVKNDSLKLKRSGTHVLMIFE